LSHPVSPRLSFMCTFFIYETYTLTPNTKMIVPATNDMKHRDIQEIIQDFLEYRRYKHGKDPLE